MAKKRLAILTAGIILLAAFCGWWLTPGKQRESRQAAMYEQLRRPITLAVSDKPLDEVLADLSRQTGVPIVIDDEVRSIWPSEFPPVSADWPGISLAAALDGLLAMHGLTFIEEDGVAWVVANPAAPSRFVGRFYSTAPPSYWASREDELLELIETMIAVDSWEAIGGLAVIRQIPGGILVINHPVVHRQIAAALVRMDPWLESRDDPTPFWLSGPTLELEQDRRLSRETLATPVSLDVVEMPLRDVLRELVVQTGIPIVLDERALQGLGLTADTPVTTRQITIPLDEALRNLLEPMYLGFFPHHEVLRVTDLGTNCPSYVLRAYPVFDLELLAVDDIEMLLTSHVEPGSWDWKGREGVSVAIGSELLIVSQTPLVHDDVEEFLGELRQASNQRSMRRAAYPRETGVARALRQPGVLEFLDAILEDVAEFIGERYGITVQLNHQAIEHLGLSGRTRVTGDFRQPTLARSLESLLSPLDLDFQESGEVLLITAPYAKSHPMRRQVFAVPDIVDPDVGAFRCPTALAFGWYDSDLSNLLTSAVLPGDWDDQGGNGRIDIVQDVLVVTHRDAARGAIEQILAWLRRRQTTLCPVCHPGAQPASAELLEELRCAEDVGSRLMAAVLYLRSADEAADRFLASARPLLESADGDHELVRELLRHEFLLLSRLGQDESTSVAGQLLRGADEEFRARLERCFRGHLDFDLVFDADEESSR